MNHSSCLISKSRYEQSEAISNCIGCETSRSASLVGSKSHGFHFLSSTIPALKKREVKIRSLGKGQCEIYENT